MTSGFGLIESWQVVCQGRSGKADAKPGAGRTLSVAVTLSEWLFRAVLTLSRGYLDLRKPLERRIYELAGKHCGRQPDWSVSVDTLLKKSGSASPRRVFRKMLRDMIAADHLPDYIMAEEPGDLIRFPRWGGVVEPVGGAGPLLSEAALDKARAMAPGSDVHALAAEWRGVWDRRVRRPLARPRPRLPRLAGNAPCGCGRQRVTPFRRIAKHHPNMTPP